jgi:hypothetical protein
VRPFSLRSTELSSIELLLNSCLGAMATDGEILSFKEYLATLPKTRKKTRTYVPTDEVMPDKPWYHLDIPDIHCRIDGISEEVQGILKDIRAEDEELISLRKAAQDIKEVKGRKPITVAVVGQQAMGKSCLINALLHRQKVSKTSADGGACTAATIKYQYNPGSDDLHDLADAQVQFMDDTTLTEMVREHIERYYHFHFSGSVDAEYFEEEKRCAQSAKLFFNLTFNTKNDARAKKTLERLLSAENFETHELLRHCLDTVSQRIREAGADDDRVKMFKGLQVDHLAREVERFVAKKGKEPPLWPIVKSVHILLGSTLLRNGVALVDLPGISYQCRSASYLLTFARSR